MSYEVTFYWGECEFVNIITSGHSESDLRDFYRKKNYDRVDVRKLSDQEYNLAIQSSKPIIEIDCG